MVLDVRQNVADIPHFSRDIPGFMQDIIPFVQDVIGVVEDIPNFTGDILFFVAEIQTSNSLRLEPKLLALGANLDLVARLEFTRPLASLRLCAKHLFV